MINGVIIHTNIDKHWEKESTSGRNLTERSRQAERRSGRADGRWLWSGRGEPRTWIGSDGTACYSGECECIYRDRNREVPVNGSGNTGLILSSSLEGGSFLI